MLFVIGGRVGSVGEGRRKELLSLRKNWGKCVHNMPLLCALFE